MLLSLAILFSTASLALAQNFATYPQVPQTASINGFADPIYAKLPDCAKNCVKENTGNTPCPYWDTGCLCIMPQWIDPVAECIASSCSGQQVVSATSLANSLCKSVGAWWGISATESALLVEAAERASPATSTENLSEFITATSASTTASSVTSSADSGLPLSTAYPQPSPASGSSKAVTPTVTSHLVKGSSQFTPGSEALAPITESSLFLSAKETTRFSLTSNAALISSVETPKGFKVSFSGIVSSGPLVNPTSDSVVRSSGLSSFNLREHSTSSLKQKSSSQARVEASTIPTTVPSTTDASSRLSVPLSQPIVLSSTAVQSAKHSTEFTQSPDLTTDTKTNESHLLIPKTYISKAKDGSKAILRATFAKTAGVSFETLAVDKSSSLASVAKTAGSVTVSPSHSETNKAHPTNVEQTSEAEGIIVSRIKTFAPSSTNDSGNQELQATKSRLEPSIASDRLPVGLSNGIGDVRIDLAAIALALVAHVM